MPGLNLTRLEAEERSSLVQVDSYDIHLDLTTGDERFRSITTVRFAAKDGASTFIDAITADLIGVRLNDVDLDVAEVSDGIRIQLPELREQNELTVVADFAYVNTGQGLHRFVDPADGQTYLYSQFEVPDSRRVFAVFEQPDLKGTFRFTVTAPADWTVVSNEPTPEPAPAHDGAHTFAFAPTPRLSSYVTAIIAGPYASVHDEYRAEDGRVVPLGIYVRESLLEHLDADYLFDVTKKGFAFYEEKFAYPYPFTKYDQIFAPEYNEGAMENAGAVTITETYVFRSKVTGAIAERRVVTVLHELAHMWFGDLVTMKWWDDLWLNESFAEWASTVATVETSEWTEGWTTFLSMEKGSAYTQDQLPSTHPIVADIRDIEDVEVNFDHITYGKGGSALKQLAAFVGLEDFFAGLSNYFHKYAFGNTVLADLLAELEATSGRDLSAWSKVWLETASLNILTPELGTDADGTITAFRIAQTSLPGFPTLRPHRLVVGFYDTDAEGRLVRTFRHEMDVAAEASTDVPELVGRKRPELVLVNDEDLTYAKIRFDPESLQTAQTKLSAIPDSLVRGLIWDSMWDATRDAELAPSAYVQLVLDHVAIEDQATSLRLILAHLAVASRTYVAPNRRRATIEKVGDALWELVQGAPAGSDRQFQFALAFAAIASTPAHAATLAALRDGRTTLEGLEIDTDLAWNLLDGLVLTGRAGEAEIRAALEADNTANGQQSAARARATIPTPDAKRAAFDLVVDGDRVTNAVARYTGLGYTHVTDPTSLEALVAPYFEMLEGVWTNRAFKVARYIINGFYPWPLASHALVEASREWLADHPAYPALRRLIIEDLAEVERATAAQHRDLEG
ncbi:aminopeptidase N [Pseudolysinimonas sp.]|uniref:aminopeptidase N n=1 Tax=Pseudolysinimonas sp. TaxID=2680009 RepID=UPI003F81C476